MSGRARTYWEEHLVKDLVTGQGFGGGGTVELRYDKVWMTAESLAREGDSRVKRLRWSLPSLSDRELERIASIGLIARRFRSAELKAHRFALIASLVLSEAEQEPSAGEQFCIEFDLLSEDSVDSALESYRQFVIETTTAALRVEQQIARERATGFWTEWEGA